MLIYQRLNCRSGIKPQMVQRVSLSTSLLLLFYTYFLLLPSHFMTLAVPTVAYSYCIRRFSNTVR